MAMNSDIPLSDLLADVEVKGQTATKDAKDEKAQAHLLTAARALVTALESPVEKIVRMCYLEESSPSVPQVLLLLTNLSYTADAVGRSPCINRL
jgi:hypothetical protein